MSYKKKMPVEIAGYRNVKIPTYLADKKCVVDKWWSAVNDPHPDDEFIPWDSEEGSEIPPF